MDKFLKVVWHDACSTDAWTRTEDLPPPIVVTSHGWLAVETPDFITLSASHYGEIEDMWGQTITIPRGMIISMDNINA